MHRFLDNLSWVFDVLNATILLINLSAEMKMGLATEDDFFCLLVHAIGEHSVLN